MGRALKGALASVAVVCAVAASAAVALTVTPAAYADDWFVYDEFSRTVNAGLGSADTGGPWSVSSTSRTKVQYGAAVFYGFTGGDQDVRAWSSLVRSDIDVLASIKLNAANPTGNKYQARVVARAQSDPRNGYSARLIHTPTGGLDWALTRVVNAGGANTVSLASGTLMTSGAAGTLWWVRLQVQAAIIRARFWRDGAAEPTTWQAQATDTYWSSGTISLAAYTNPGVVSPYPSVRFGAVYAKSLTPAVPSIYWGAFVNGEEYGYGDPPWDMRSLDTFESHAQKKVSLLAIGSSWAGSNAAFPKSAMEKIRQHGSIPFFSWSPRSGGSTTQSAYQLADIINGTYDSYVRTWAQAAKSWGHPFFLRFAWEMNGNWYPWSERVNGNQKGQYVQMWRHVHDIFNSVGATNVTWVWCPNRGNYSADRPLSGLYPGDGYVDWTCIDGYNKGTHPTWGEGKWESFAQALGPTYDTIMGFASSKPMVIGETASTEYGGSKAAWITDMLTSAIPLSYPKIKAFLWFNWDEKMDAKIETSASAQAAFAAGIQSSLYARNDFATAAGKIQPLR